MTQEEKAKAHDKALEKIKYVMEHSVSPIFSELIESEDERIRKALVKAVSVILKGHKLYDTDVTREEALSWLEKQGNKPQCKTALGAIHEETIDNANKVVQKKFRIGDFIVNDYCFGKVIEITNDAYLLDTGQGIPFSYEHNAHLWTIADAKDGDVLVSNSNQPFIYNRYYNAENVGAYCGILCDGSMFIETTSYQWTDNKNIKPATKEQSDLLFQKMSEAGYEWNVEKKELRKIEQKPKWSEDDKMIDWSITNLAELMHRYGAEYGKVGKCIDWLKSLKQRMEDKK